MTLPIIVALPLAWMLATGAYAPLVHLSLTYWIGDKWPKGASFAITALGNLLAIALVVAGVQPPSHDPLPFPPTIM